MEDQDDSSHAAMDVEDMMMVTDIKEELPDEANVCAADADSQLRDIETEDDDDDVIIVDAEKTMQYLSGNCLLLHILTKFHQ